MLSHARMTLKPLYIAVALLAAVHVAGCSSPEEQAQEHYERGMELLAKNDSMRASIEFKNALQKKKDLIGAWRGLAKIEEQNRNFSGVAAILRTVAELDPNDTDARLRLARLLVLSNNLDEALEQVEAAEKIAPQNADALAVRAAVELKLNNLDAAVTTARKSLELDPKNAEAVIVLSAERMARNQLQQALNVLDEHADALNDDLGVQLFRLTLYERMNKQVEIESLLRKIAEQHPKELSIRRQLVRYYIDQKRLDDAEQEVRAIAESDPADSEAALDVARFLNSFRGPQAAEEELKSRIQAGGDIFGYQMLLANLYVARDQEDQGVAILERVIKEDAAPNNVLAAKIRLAEINLAAKKLDAASGLVAEILETDARNGDALRLRASIAMEKEQYDPAIADLRQALNDQPKSTELMQGLALAYERKGEIELAEKQYADATKAATFDPAVGLNYVAFLRRRDGLERAEDVLTEILARAPRNTSVLSTLAEVRLARQNWIGAQEIADKLRGLGADRSTADQILVAALNGQRKYDESIGLLQSTYATTPGSTRPMYGLVNTLVRAGKSDRATAFLQTVLEKDPANADALVLLGSIQLADNQSEKAAQSFKAAIEGDPSSIVGYRALANMQLQQADADAAIATLKTGIGAQPQSGVLRVALASAYEINKDYEAAIKEYESLISEESGSMIVANNLASLLSDHRDDAASLERAYTLAASLRESPVPHFKDTLGWIQYRRGEYRAAASLLEKAVEALPDLPLARYHLGKTYVALNEPDKATQHLQKGLELAANDAALKQKIETALQEVGKS
jgi:tetratricopeptide (TPR) repeat protein